LHKKLSLFQQNKLSKLKEYPMSKSSNLYNISKIKFVPKTLEIKIFLPNAISIKR